MADTTVRQFIFTALIVTAIIAGTFALIAESVPQSGSSDLSMYNNTLNKFQEIKTSTDEITSDTQSAGGNVNRGAFGIINDLIEYATAPLSLVWKSLTTLKALIADVAEGSIIPLPSWFSGWLIGMVGVTLAFAVIAVWFRWYI